MLDKLIIMSVNTTIKSDLCVMYHSVKRHSTIKHIKATIKAK